MEKSNKIDSPFRNGLLFMTGKASPSSNNTLKSSRNLHEHYSKIDKSNRFTDNQKNISSNHDQLNLAQYNSDAKYSFNKDNKINYETKDISESESNSNSDSLRKSNKFKNKSSSKIVSSLLKSNQQKIDDYMVKLQGKIHEQQMLKKISESDYKFFLERDAVQLKNKLTMHENDMSSGNMQNNDLWHENYRKVIKNIVTTNQKDLDNFFQKNCKEDKTSFLKAQDDLVATKNTPKSSIFKKNSPKNKYQYDSQNLTLNDQKSNNLNNQDNSIEKTNLTNEYEDTKSKLSVYKDYLGNTEHIKYSSKFNKAFDKNVDLKNNYENINQSSTKTIDKESSVSQEKKIDSGKKGASQNLRYFLAREKSKDYLKKQIDMRLLLNKSNNSKKGEKSLANNKSINSLNRNLSPNSLGKNTSKKSLGKTFFLHQTSPENKRLEISNNKSTMLLSIHDNLRNKTSTNLSKNMSNGKLLNNVSFNEKMDQYVRNKSKNDLINSNITLQINSKNSNSNKKLSKNDSYINKKDERKNELIQSMFGNKSNLGSNNKKSQRNNSRSNKKDETMLSMLSKKSENDEKKNKASIKEKDQGEAKLPKMPMFFKYYSKNDLDSNRPYNLHIEDEEKVQDDIQKKFYIYNSKNNDKSSQLSDKIKTVDTQLKTKKSNYQTNDFLTTSNTNFRQKKLYESPDNNKKKVSIREYDPIQAQIEKNLTALRSNKAELIESNPEISKTGEDFQKKSNFHKKLPLPSNTVSSRLYNKDRFQETDAFKNISTERSILKSYKKTVNFPLKNIDTNNDNVFSQSKTKFGIDNSSFTSYDRSFDYNKTFYKPVCGLNHSDFNQNSSEKYVGYSSAKECFTSRNHNNYLKSYLNINEDKRKTSPKDNSFIKNKIANSNIDLQKKSTKKINFYNQNDVKTYNQFEENTSRKTKKNNNQYDISKFGSLSNLDSSNKNLTGGLSSHRITEKNAPKNNFNFSTLNSARLYNELTSSRTNYPKSNKKHWNDLVEKHNHVENLMEYCDTTTKSNNYKNYGMKDLKSNLIINVKDLEEFEKIKVVEKQLQKKFVAESRARRQMLGS